MKTVALLIFMLAPLPGQQKKPAAPPAGSTELESVLSEMDRAAANFKSAQAALEWENYQKASADAGDEPDKQTGQVYFRHNDKDVEAMFDITSTPSKQVLFKRGKLSLYNRKSDTVTEHDAGKNKGDVVAFLSLGFGARGHDLANNYQVTMTGWEKIDGTRVARLELVAKSEKVRNMFSQFILWIDPKQDIPLKQKALEPGGDFWTSHYSNFKLNAKISGDVFRLDTTSKTTYVKQ